MNEIRLLSCLLYFLMLFYGSAEALSEGGNINNASLDEDITENESKKSKKKSLWPFSRSKKKAASNQKTESTVNRVQETKITDTTEKTKNKRSLWSFGKSKNKNERNNQPLSAETENSVGTKNLSANLKNSKKNATKEKSNSNIEEKRSTALIRWKSLMSRKPKNNATVNEFQKTDTKTNSINVKKTKNPKNIQFKIDLSNFAKKYKAALTNNKKNLNNYQTKTNNRRSNNLVIRDEYFDDYEPAFDETPIFQDEYFDNYGSVFDEDFTEERGTRNSFSRTRSYPQTKSKRNNKKVKQEDIKFNIDLSQFLADENGEDDDESDISEDSAMIPSMMPVQNPMMGLQSLPQQQLDQSIIQNPPAMVMPSLPQQQPDQSIIQTPPIMAQSEISQGINATNGSNQEINNQINAQESNGQYGIQQPYYSDQLYLTFLPQYIPVNGSSVSTYSDASNQLPQDTAIANSKPSSFLETFVQNLSGQNNDNQNLNQGINQQPNENLYYQNMNRANQNITGNIGSMNGMSFSGSMFGNKGSTRNMSDDEVAEEVIRYLRDLGVIDESKFIELNIDQIGTCIRCRKQKIVIMLDKGKRMGICKTCAGQLVSDAQAGKFIGNENKFRRDSAADLSEDMIREGLNQRKGDSVLGSLGKTLFGDSGGATIGNIASAALSAALTKDSSANANNQTNPLNSLTGNLVPSNYAAEGIAAAQPNFTQQAMNQQGIIGSGSGTSTEQMVLNSAGQLVPLSSLAGSAAPYGYKKDSNGNLVPATSLEEALAATQQNSAQQAMNQQGIIGSGSGTSTEQMVLNSAGQLVPLSSLAGSAAPYGYKKDSNGNLVPATSLEEALAATQQNSAQQAMNQQGSIQNGMGTNAVNGMPLGQMGTTTMGMTSTGIASGGIDPYNQQLSNFNTNALDGNQTLNGQNSKWQTAGKIAAGVAATAGVVGTAALLKNALNKAEQMILDATGNLVPLSSLANSDTPFGYKKDSNGNLVPATSLEEGLAAAEEVKAANKKEKLKKVGKVAAGVAATGVAALGVKAIVNAVKKSKNSNNTAINGGSNTSNSNNTAINGGSNTSNSNNTAINGGSNTSNSNNTATSGGSASPSSGQYSAEEVSKAKKNSDNLIKKIKKIADGIKSIEQKIVKAKEKVQKMGASQNSERDKNRLASAKEELERLQKSLESQQQSLETLQQQRNALVEKYGGEPGGPS